VVLLPFSYTPGFCGGVTVSSGDGGGEYVTTGSADAGVAGALVASGVSGVGSLVVLKESQALLRASGVTVPLMRIIL
jgi:hypothetical protein